MFIQISEDQQINLNEITTIKCVETQPGGMNDYTYKYKLRFIKINEFMDFSFRKPSRCSSTNIFDTEYFDSKEEAWNWLKEEKKKANVQQIQIYF